MALFKGVVCTSIFLARHIIASCYIPSAKDLGKLENIGEHRRSEEIGIPGRKTEFFNV